jgi:hypothetical protein
MPSLRIIRICPHSCCGRYARAFDSRVMQAAAGSHVYRPFTLLD